MFRVNKVGVTRRGFTIVELIVVVVVIGILAGISIVGYGSWHTQAVANQLKSDLNNAMAAMESYRTFNNGYPTAVPASFSPSKGVSLSGGSADTLTYCIEATSIENSSIVYYAASEIKDRGPQVGTCAQRDTLPVPGVPTNLAVASSTGTSIGLVWSSPVVNEVASYDIQCAIDGAFTVGVKSTSPTAPVTSAMFDNLSPNTNYYCHIRAVNTKGSSAWSASVNTTTTNTYGSLAVGTSIEGYWTSAPQGFLLEDGSAVSRTTYASLFAVIGTTYGTGDGSTTFNLPDSRGRTLVNLSSSDAEFDTMGEKPGSKTETITIAQMPSHTHVQTQHNHIGAFAGVNQNGGYGTTSTVVAGNINGQSGTDTANHDYTSSDVATNQSTGGGGAHNNIQPSITKMAAIKYTLPDAAAVTLPAGSSSQGYWTTAPSEYLLENGAAVSRTTYAALFAAIGTTYGAGDGSTTFNLPDSRGRVTVNKSSTDAEFDTMGEKTGTKSETLTIAQMPSHTHIQNAHNHTEGFSGVNGNGSYGVIASAPVGNITNQGGTSMSYHAFTSWTIATNQSTGGGGSHNNIMPSIVKMSAIKYTDTSGSIGAPVATGTSLQGYWGATPAGYLLEDGSAVSRTIYAALYTAIGTTYGAGDGATTFNLPDSRGRVGVNRSTADPEFNTMGEKTGSKTETLTIAQMPSHTHIQNAHNHIAGFAGVNATAGYGVAPSAGVGNINSQSGTTTINRPYVSPTTGVNLSTGGGGAHNNIQPSIVKLVVIKY